MALFGLLNSNSTLWKKIARDSKSEYYKLIISDFLLKDNISIHKYSENEKANNYASFNVENSINQTIEMGIKPTSTFMRYLLDMGNRSPTIPNWFYLAYPDVYWWTNKNGQKFEDEFEKYIAGKNMNEQEQLLHLLRFSINQYIIRFKKLECSS